MQNTRPPVFLYAYIFLWSLYRNSHTWDFRVKFRIQNFHVPSFAYDFFMCHLSHTTFLCANLRIRLFSCANLRIRLFHVLTFACSAPSGLNRPVALHFTKLFQTSYIYILCVLFFAFIFIFLFVPFFACWTLPAAQTCEFWHACHECATFRIILTPDCIYVRVLAHRIF